jgi:hypothetical protein
MNAVQLTKLLTMWLLDNFFNRNKPKKTLNSKAWFPTNYICPICDSPILRQVKVYDVHTGIIAGSFSNGFMTRSKGLISKDFKNTSHYKCNNPSCGMHFFTTIFLNKRQLTEEEKKFKEAFKRS